MYFVAVQLSQVTFGYRYWKDLIVKPCVKDQSKQCWQFDGFAMLGLWQILQLGLEKPNAKSVSKLRKHDLIFLTRFCLRSSSSFTKRSWKRSAKTHPNRQTDSQCIQVSRVSAAIVFCFISGLQNSTQGSQAFYAKKIVAQCSGCYLVKSALNNCLWVLLSSMYWSVRILCKRSLDVAKTTHNPWNTHQCQHHHLSSTNPMNPSTPRQVVCWGIDGQLHQDHSVVISHCQKHILISVWKHRTPREQHNKAVHSCFPKFLSCLLSGFPLALVPSPFPLVGRSLYSPRFPGTCWTSGAELQCDAKVRMTIGYHRPLPFRALCHPWIIVNHPESVQRDKEV